MSKRWIILLGAASLIAVNALPVALAADGGTDRPFKAEFAGQVHWEFPGDYACTCIEVSTATEATGKAKQLASSARQN